MTKRTENLNYDEFYHLQKFVPPDTYNTLQRSSRLFKLKEKDVAIKKYEAYIHLLSKNRHLAPKWLDPEFDINIDWIHEAKKFKQTIEMTEELKYAIQNTDLSSTRKLLTELNNRLDDESFADLKDNLLEEITLQDVKPYKAIVFMIKYNIGFLAAGAVPAARSNKIDAAVLFISYGRAIGKDFMELAHTYNELMEIAQEENNMELYNSLKKFGPLFGRRV